MKWYAMLALTVGLACSRPSESIRPSPVDAGALAVPQPPPPVRRRAIPSSTSKDTRTESQLADAACTGPKNEWLCPARKRPMALSAQAPIIPPGLTIPNFYVDPSNSVGCALDSNSGTSATCVGGCSGSACPSGTGPLATYAEIYGHRWGSLAPNLQQQTVVWFLSDQGSPWSDPVMTESMTTANTLGFAGTLLAQTTVAIGTFTHRNAAAATFNTITAQGQSGAYWAPYVGMLVDDVTAGAWFWVEADLGSATALITEPFNSDVILPSLSPSFNSYNSAVANGDSLTVLRPTRINGTSFGNAYGPIVFQHAQFTHSPPTLGGAYNFAEVSFDVTGGPDATADGAPTLYNSYIGSSGMFLPNGGAALAGAINPQFCAAFGGTGARTAFTLDGDVVLDKSSGGAEVFNPCTTGYVDIARAGLRTVWDVNPGSQSAAYLRIILSEFDSRLARLWGPYAIGGYDYQMYVENVDGITASNSLLLLGHTARPSGFSIDGVYTGYPWLPGSHAFGAAQTITGASLDDAGSLVHPGIQGSRYVLQMGTN